MRASSAAEMRGTLVLGDIAMLSLAHGPQVEQSLDARASWESRESAMPRRRYFCASARPVNPSLEFGPSAVDKIIALFSLHPRPLQ